MYHNSDGKYRVCKWDNTFGRQIRSPWCNYHSLLQWHAPIGCHNGYHDSVATNRDTQSQTRRYVFFIRKIYTLYVHNPSNFLSIFTHVQEFSIHQRSTLYTNWLFLPQWHLSDRLPEIFILHCADIVQKCVYENLKRDRIQSVLWHCLYVDKACIQMSKINNESMSATMHFACAGCTHVVFYSIYQFGRFTIDCQ